jgi:hypothetical protein
MKKLHLGTKITVILLAIIFASMYLIDDLRLANVFAGNTNTNGEVVVNQEMKIERYNAAVLEELTQVNAPYDATPMIYAFNHGYTGNVNAFTGGDDESESLVAKLQAETGADVYHVSLFQKRDSNGKIVSDPNNIKYVMYKDGDVSNADAGNERYAGGTGFSLKYDLVEGREAHHDFIGRLIYDEHIYDESKGDTTINGVRYYRSRQGEINEFSLVLEKYEYPFRGVTSRTVETFEDFNKVNLEKYE